MVHSSSSLLSLHSGFPLQRRSIGRQSPSLHVYSSSLQAVRECCYEGSLLALDIILYPPLVVPQRQVSERGSGHSRNIRICDHRQFPPSFLPVKLNNTCVTSNVANTAIPEITLLARAVSATVGRHSGGRLATTLVATKNVFIFFWHERRRCSRSPSGVRLATTLVDRYFHHYFFFPFFPFFPFSVATFSHRRSARIKKLI